MGTEERCRRQVPEGGSVGLGGRCPVLRWIDDLSKKLTARAVASAFMSLRTNALQPDYCDPAAQPHLRQLSARMRRESRCRRPCTIITSSGHWSSVAGGPNRAPRASESTRCRMGREDNGLRHSRGGSDGAASRASWVPAPTNRTRRLGNRSGRSRLPIDACIALSGTTG